MNRYIKYVATAMAALTISAAMAAGPSSFEQVREMVADNTPLTVTRDVMIEGIIISDCDSPNMELNVNISQAKMDLTPNRKTAYIESLDGRYGFRLQFEYPEDNELHRYDKALINLKNARIVKETEPERYTITGLSSENVMDIEKCDASVLPRKEKFINELTDDDVYTFVTLKEVEFVIKNGSYTNIWEPYCIKSELHSGAYDVTSRMDGWASLLRDTRDNAIYMLVNTSCLWRRTGKRIPQGLVSLSGIVVKTDVRRYGGNMGRYSIRPVDENDIVADKKSKSPYKVLLGWFLDNNPDASLEFEFTGVKTGIAHKNEIRGDRVLAEIGKGYLWTTSNSYIMITSDFNNTGTDDRGAVKNGAIMFKAPTPDWYSFDEQGKVNGANSFFIEFSTEKIKGTQMALCFDFGAGNQDADGSWNFPVEWKVAYSVDGRKWITLKDSATGSNTTILRTVPFWPKVVKGSGNPKPLPTGYDCGMGLTQHTYALPASAFGHKQVFISISPASTKLSQIRSKPENDVIMDHAVVRQTTKQETIMRFGQLYICYK